MGYYSEAELEVASLRAEVDRLQAIVDRLPKDANGNPLDNDTRYWWTACDEVRSGHYAIVEDSRQCAWNPDCPGVYHTTREAAEETRSKEGIELERERSETPRRRRHWTRIGQFDSTDHDPC